MRTELEWSNERSIIKRWENTLLGENKYCSSLFRLIGLPLSSLNNEKKASLYLFFSFSLSPFLFPALPLATDFSRFEAARRARAAPVGKGWGVGGGGGVRDVREWGIQLGVSGNNRPIYLHCHVCNIACVSDAFRSASHCYVRLL